MSVCHRLLPLVLIAATTPANAADNASAVQVVPKSAAAGDFAGLVDIVGGRKLYIACRGKGSPTVMLIGGLRASADDWMETLPGKPNVFSAVAAFTRVCAYDRPGTPVGDQPSRSDRVAQPTTAADAVADLHGLIVAAGVETPAVLVGHSYGGLITRLYASTYPDEVSGMVLVDALSEGLRQAETQQEWAIQRELISGDTNDSVKLYPALEQLDVDRSFDQLLASSPIKPMPLIVLSADRPWGPQVPALIAKGDLPADVPKDFGYVTDRAQKEAQAKLAALVPGAKHITETRSGHEIHRDQPQLVTDAIREVVEAVRSRSSQLVP
jgi:pimeloyl-ACP methyl ester carboxylesterase